MIIKYTNFSDGIHTFKMTKSAQKLGLEDLFFGDVEVDIKMDKSIHQIVLDCDLLVHAKIECDRCTEEVEKDYNIHFLLSYLFSKKPEQTDDLNLKILSLDQDKIDISKDVFEYAELSLPLKKLCKEDCKGLCLKCGKNLNYGSCDCTIEKNNDVWAPLQQLKEKFNNKQ